MSLITEDGTGLSTAQSYASVAEADAYFLAKGEAAWVVQSSGSDFAQGVHSITRESGSFLDDGWAVGASGVIADSGANNGASFVVSEVAALTLTIPETLTAQTKAETVACVLASLSPSTRSKEAALIRATAALDGDSFVRGGYWPGHKATADQALAWPREHAWDADGFPLVSVVPAAVKRGTFEAALLELASAGILSESLERGGMLISKTTGPISKTWSDKAPSRTIYPTIRQALARVCKPSEGVQCARVIRDTDVHRGRF